jgi:NAD+ kinase
MNGLFSKIGIIGKPGDPKVKTTLRTLADHLSGHGLAVVAEARSNELLDNGAGTACPLATLGEQCDLVIVVGGDGTFLGAARALATSGVPLLGVNVGRLGFLVDISPDALLDAVDRIFTGDFDEEYRFLLSARIGPSPQQGVQSPALNDVVLHKWNTPRMVEFETYIDGRFVNAQRSDGLIVSTPTGSTAYALSGGGPLLHPSLNALLIVSICPHTLSNRPIVVSGDSRIEIRLCGGDHTHVRISCDGQSDRMIGDGEHLYIQKSTHPVRLLHPKGHDHYKILRAKLGWGGHPSL